MKDSGYIMVWNWLFADGLTMSEAMVLSYIANVCKMNGGRCERSIAQIAADLNTTPRVLRPVLATLEGRYIVTEQKGDGRGHATIIRLSDEVAERVTKCNPLRAERVTKCYPLTPEKGNKMSQKGLQNVTLSQKEKRSKKEKEEKELIKKERVRESARTHEPSLSEADAVAIVRRYEGRQHDPNGREFNPTEAETAEYNEALAAVSRYKAERAEAEFAEVMERFPDLREWKQQPTADHYARLVAEYGKADVEEAMQYAANRIDLKYQYLNPLGYVEGNIKGRKAGIQRSKPAARR